MKIANGKTARVSDKVWVWTTGGLRDKIVHSFNEGFAFLYYGGEFGMKSKRPGTTYPIPTELVYKTKDDAIKANPDRLTMTECAAVRYGTDRGIRLEKQRQKRRKLKLKKVA